MKKRIVFLAAVGFLFMGLLTACGEGNNATAQSQSEPSSGADYSNEVYAFITASSNLEYYNQHKKATIDACRELGVQASIVGDDHFDASIMTNLLAATIEKNVAGILLMGQFPDAYTPLIDEAWAKGIPVVIQETDIPESKRVCYIANDWYTYGQKQMDLMAEAMEGRGKLLISTSMDSGQPSVDHLRGVRDRIAEKYPGITIVGVLEDKGITDIAVSVISAAIQANPDIDGILGGQSVSAISAVTACREAGILDRVKIVGNDREQATLEAIKSGYVYGTICGKQYSEAYYGIKFLYDFHHANIALSNDDRAAGLLAIPSYLDLGTINITRENVDYFIGFDYEYK